MLCEICHEPITKEEIDAGELVAGSESYAHKSCAYDFYRDPVEDDYYEYERES